MTYRIKAQGREALVDGPSDEDLKGYWQRFLDNVSEVIGERPTRTSRESTAWEERRERYLRTLMARHAGYVPEHVEEIDVFLAMIVRYGFHCADEPETVTLVGMAG